MDQARQQAPISLRQEQQAPLARDAPAATDRKRRGSKAEAAVNGAAANSYYCHARSGKATSHNSTTAPSTKTPLPVGDAPRYGSCEVSSVCCMDSRFSRSDKPALTGGGRGGVECGFSKPEGGSGLERLASRIPCLGIILSLGASLFLGSAGMLVKMTQSVHGVQVAVLR